MPAKVGMFVLMLAILAGGCRLKKTEQEKDPSPQVEPLKPTPDAKYLEPPTDVPATYQVRFETSQGDFVVQVHRKWAPRGADRFYQLVKSGFYDGCRFFRVVPKFVVQWGINGDPDMQAKWRLNVIPDDPMRNQSNRRGTMTFANAGRNTRTAQVFINLVDNPRLDRMHLDPNQRSGAFVPFGEVTEGMSVVASIYSGYREKPDQDQIERLGNKNYLNREFPKLDYIKKATLIEPKKKPVESKTRTPDKTRAEKTPAKTS